MRNNRNCGCMVFFFLGIFPFLFSPTLEHLYIARTQAQLDKFAHFVTLLLSLERPPLDLYRRSLTSNAPFLSTRSRTIVQEGCSYVPRCSMVCRHSYTRHITRQSNSCFHTKHTFPKLGSQLGLQRLVLFGGGYHRCRAGRFHSTVSGLWGIDVLVARFEASWRHMGRDIVITDGICSPILETHYLVEGQEMARETNRQCFQPTFQTDAIFEVYPSFGSPTFPADLW